MNVNNSVEENIKIILEREFKGKIGETKEQDIIMARISLYEILKDALPRLGVLGRVDSPEGLKELAEQEYKKILQPKLTKLFTEELAQAEKDLLELEM